MSKHISTIISIAISGFLFSTSSFAQYVWLDEKGTKQFSDLPPPISTPKNRILKTPFKTPSATMSKNSIEEVASGAVSENEKLQKPVTTASKNEDFMKRKLEQEEKDKKAATEKQAAEAKSKNCERLRSYQQSLASGIRISNTDKNGERSFMTDAQRAQELADAQRSLGECK
ncbi:MAG: DUF4124 domain-containing protein [Undibacterium sp.]|nr:DUF4124 domain-containing protein [Undibacterium sp.]